MTNRKIHAPRVDADNAGEVFESLTSRTRDEGNGDGLSPQTAVDVKSVRDEYAWLSQHHPAYQFVKQELCWSVLGWLDVIDIITAAGQARTIHFRLEGGPMRR